jgi:hypothetical protein
MLFAIQCQMGEGFHIKMKPLLEDKRTLYIGPRARQTFLRREWYEFEIDYVTYYRLPETLGGYDQVLLECLKINTRTRRVKDLLRLLKTKDIPLFFRPEYGCMFDPIILEEARASYEDSPNTATSV